MVDLKHISEEEHLSIVIYCHAGSGKITNTGRLIFEWGGPPGREWNNSTLFRNSLLHGPSE